MNNLLIHADPGARSGFVAAWLQDELTHAGFDVGATARPRFLKIHKLDHAETIKSFNGAKIRIKSTVKLLNLQLLLFLRKNVQIQLLNFTKDEYNVETFSKVYIFAKECFTEETQVDYSLYDYAITFDDTFDMDKMIDLYYLYNNRYPDTTHIDLAVQHNKINQITLDPNHACSIAAMVLETETAQNLLEENRYWSLPKLYQTTPVIELYQTIKSKIVLENYSND